MFGCSNDWRRAYGFLALVLVVSWAGAARAQDVPLQQNGCPETWREPLEKLVTLELNSLVDERPRARLSDIRQVNIECSELQVTVTVTPSRGQPFTRTLAREDDEAGSQPRILALTAAELADSIWFVAPKSAKEAPSRPYRRIEAAGRRWVLLVGGAAELLGEPRLLGLGAQVSVEHHLLPLLSTRFEVRGTLASTQRLGTEIRARSLSGLLTALLGEHAFDRKQRWSWGVGPGVRVGWAQIVGIPLEPPEVCPPPGCELFGDDLRGLWLGPVLTGRVSFVTPEAVVFSAAVEGGVVTRSVIGTDSAGQALFGYQGLWAGGGLSIGSAF